MAFLIQGKNRVGAVADALSKLAIAKVNVTAAQAISSGEGRYGVIIWVKPQSVDRAARALGIS